MKYVLDASVALCWVIPRPLTPKAVRLRDEYQRKIHELLIEAALATPGVLSEPRPFVWQTALNDFYVTYEINAYTRTPRDMIDIYAALHGGIQDAFYAAGVEIMSPHYTSLRDGNTVAIPEAFRSPDYRPSAFRVENTSPQRDPSGKRAEIAPPG